MNLLGLGPGPANKDFGILVANDRSWGYALLGHESACQ